MRRGLTELAADHDLLVEPRMLVARRQDLVADRTRMVNRLRTQMPTVPPALERALDLTTKGPLNLLTGYQRPAETRRLGVCDLAGNLAASPQGPQSRRPGRARRAGAAMSQTTTLPGEEPAAQLIAQLAEGMMTLNEQIKDVEQLIEDRFRQPELAEVITSMPGTGVLLGAEFLIATGGDLDGFASACHLAGYAGLAPAPRDSGRLSGNLHRPRRYNQMLNHVLYTSALISIQHNPKL